MRPGGAQRFAPGLLAALALLALAAPAGAQEEEPAEPAAEAAPPRVVQEGDWVSLEFFVILQNGQVFGSNVHANPLEVKQGAGRWVPGVERALLGMHVGETKRVVVGPEDAYGPVDPLAFEEVPLTSIPKSARRPGQAVIVKRGEERRPVRIAEIRGDKAVLDWNHPLAGKTLTFDIRILDIKDEPTPVGAAPAGDAAVQAR